MLVLVLVLVLVQAAARSGMHIQDYAVALKEKDERHEDYTVRYTVRVTTGDVKGAGTDANVFVELFGERGQSLGC